MKELNEGMKEWRKEWMNEWQNEWMNQWNLPTSSSKSAPTSVLYDFCVKWSSRYSLVHILPTPSSKSARKPSIFHIFIWNRALATVARTFCRPHLPKVLRPRQFFTIFMWNQALATVLCTFRRPLLQIEARNRGNRDPTSATTEATSPEITGFRARGCFQAWIHAFPTCYTSQLLDDDVVDGENAAHDNRP